jgi:hypothetical protein
LPPDRCPLNPLCRVVANTIIAGQRAPIAISPPDSRLLLADSGLTKLRDNLAKYNPGQETVDKIVSALEP